MFKLALAQTKHPQNGNVAELVDALTREAAEQGCSMIVFPECLMTPFEKTPEDFQRSAEPLDGPFAQAMGEIAARYGIWMVHTLNEKNPQKDGKPFNTAVVLDDNGVQQGVYRKTHLYIAHTLDESEKMAFGGELFTPVRTPFCTLGLGICYDLRFPELTRAAALQGCELMVFPTAWVKGPNKQLHWETLLAARAIENEIFVAGCCRADDRYLGYSQVIDPLGNVLVRGGEEEALLIAEIDPSAVARAREGMPIMEHRRPELYRPIAGL